MYTGDYIDKKDIEKYLDCKNKRGEYRDALRTLASAIEVSYEELYLFKNFYLYISWHLLDAIKGYKWEKLTADEFYKQVVATYNEMKEIAEL